MIFKMDLMLYFCERIKTRGQDPMRSQAEKHTEPRLRRPNGIEIGLQKRVHVVAPLCYSLSFKSCIFFNSVCF